MGYFDGIVDLNFKKLSDGKIAFYPHGIFGSGRVLSSEQAEAVKKFLRIYYVRLFLPVVVIGVLVNYIKFYGIILAILFVLISFIVYYIKMKPLLSGSEKTNERQGLRERLETMAVSMGFRTVILLFVGALLMSGLGVLILFIPKSPKIIGIFAIVFFGLGVLQFAYCLYLHIKGVNISSSGSRE